MPREDRKKPLKLKFAPLIRVSTEKQEKQGESLSTQRKQLDEAIRSLGGTALHWYAGQEHATPEQERKILEELIEDAKAKKFDAVMVADLSRWSRDNFRSKTDLKILKSNEIRFFVRTSEFDLNDYFQSFMIGMNVEVAEFFARQQAYKSQINRIERAKRGIPTSGRLPYGRRFNKETSQWEVIPEAKEKIETIAREYLEKDVDFSTLGKRYGMNASYLHSVLTKRCGDRWTIRFKSPIQNKDRPYEEIPIKGVPRLLDEETIRRIREKCEGRRTWAHGVQKYHYIFSRKIFDVGTGYALTGTTNKKGQRYYRPYKGEGAYQYSINADVLENAVMEELFEALSNKRKLKQAVFDGNPIGDVVEKILGKIAQKQKELKSINAKLSNYEKAIESFQGDDMGSYLNRLKLKIRPLNDSREAIESEIELYRKQLDSLPTEQEIEDTSKRSKDILKRIKESYFTSGHSFRNLTYEGKKKLIDLILGGRDNDKKRYGVYIKSLGGKPKRYKFEAYGRFGIIGGSLESRSGKFNVFPDSEMYGQCDKDSGVIEGVSKLMRETEFKENKVVGKEHMLSKCDAYYCFCFY